MCFWTCANISRGASVTRQYAWYRSGLDSTTTVGVSGHVVGSGLPSRSTKYAAMALTFSALRPCRSPWLTITNTPCPARLSSARRDARTLCGPCRIVGCPTARGWSGNVWNVARSLPSAASRLSAGCEDMLAFLPHQRRPAQDGAAAPVDELVALVADGR